MKKSRYFYIRDELNRVYPRMTVKEWEFKDEASLIDYFTKHNFTPCKDESVKGLYKIVDNGLSVKNAYSEVVKLVRREIVDYWKAKNGLFYCRVGRKLEVGGLR